jgi:SAM-dependent MidA family methyltransferase
MFGELVGACLADCWQRAKAPTDAIFVELGPGRGTLAADALRVLRQAGFAGEVHLVETSPVLRDRQRERLPDARWHGALDTLPIDRPLLVVANEFFDALPIRQWVGETERQVTLAGDRLAFTPDGPIREDSPVRSAVAAQLGALIANSGGMALVIDYGHARSADGDTLQALREHRFADPLASPGEQDLTAHVDFAALGNALAALNVALTPVVPQGEWLERLGIAARADALASAQPERAAEIAAMRHRLTDPDQMGTLFKVVAAHAAVWPPPAGFAT